MTSWWRRLSQTTRGRIQLALIIAGVSLVLVPAVWIIWQTYVPAPTSGEVVGRKFVPEHRVQDPSICVARNKDGACTHSIPQSHVEPDSWFLTLHGCAVARDGKERCRTNEVEVSEYTFIQCETGSYYDRSQGLCPPR